MVKSKATTPSQFRLTPQELAILDAIAAKQSQALGVRFTRTDAIRLSASEYAKTHGIEAKKRK